MPYVRNVILLHKNAQLVAINPLLIYLAIQKSQMIANVPKE